MVFDLERRQNTTDQVEMSCCHSLLMGQSPEFASQDGRRKYLDEASILKMRRNRLTVRNAMKEMVESGRRRFYAYQ
jgi:hypothetical protein